MKKLLFVLCLALCTMACHSEPASAAHPHPYGFGFQPFGFYQPYGAQYGSNIRTPPYFATNPPVYYGTRHARPYGVSPFASPPQVRAPATYTARRRSQFESGPAGAPCCNPYVHPGAAHSVTASKKGPVRRNPYVQTAETPASMAQNDAS